MNIDIEKKPLDWIAGKETGVKPVRAISDWKPLLPPGEKQRFNKIDTSACTIYSGTHGLCAQIMADMRAGLYSDEALDFFQAAGYLKDGVFNVSELFNAKLAGTTEEGTFMSAMGNSYRHDGLLPQDDLPTPPNLTWSQYYSLTITNAMRTKAQQFLQYVEAQYQWMNDAITDEQQSLAPVQLSIAVCPGWSTDSPIKACSGPMQHCVIQYGKNGGRNIQDSYEPFLKTLASDYKVFAVMQYIAIPRMPVPKITKPNGYFNTVIEYASPNAAEVTRIQTFLAWNNLLDPKYICGVFGPRTLQAIKDFQYKYEYDILIPAGAPEPTGKWGLFTRAKANSILAGDYN